MRTGRGLRVWTLYQIGLAIGFYWPFQPAISSGLCRSLNTFAANASRSSWTLIVRSTMYFFLIAVWSRWWRSMRTAVSLRWQRSVGRVARVCKPSSAPGVPPPGFSSKSRGARQRCRARRLCEPWSRCPSFRSLMFAYVQAFLEQVMVSVACNGAHGLKQRLARWLLMMRDRGDEDALQITQDLLAEMLGVQRPTITNAAGELERAGLIERGRQQVTILDRPGLTAASCECYQLVRERVTFHLPKTYM